MKRNEEQNMSDTTKRSIKVRLNVRTKLLSGYVIMVALLVAVFIIATNGLHTMGDSGRTVIEETKYLGRVTEMSTLVAKEWQLYTDYSVTGNTELLGEARAVGQEITTGAEELRHHFDTIKSFEVGGAIDRFITAHQQFVNDSERAVIYLVYDLQQDSSQMMAVLASSALLSTTMNDLESILDQTVEAAIVQADSTRRSAVILTAVLAAVSLLVAAGLGLFLSQRISSNVTSINKAMKQASIGDLTAEVSTVSSDELGEMGLTYRKMVKDLSGLIDNVRQTASRLASASSQLARAAEQAGTARAHKADNDHQLANGADVITGSIVTVGYNEKDGTAVDAATIVSHIYNATQLVSDKAQKAASGAVRTAIVAKNGMDNVEKSIKGLTKVTFAMDDVADAVIRIGQHSDRLLGISTIVNKIADEINLIARNVADEMVEEGNHSADFVIVASEVKQVAERTNNAAQDVSSHINAVLKDVNECIRATNDGSKRVEEGYKLASEASTALNKVMDAVEETSGYIDQILAAAEEVSITSSGVNNMIESVVQEMTNSSRLLAQMSDELQVSVAMFKTSEKNEDLTKPVSTVQAIEEAVSVAK